MPTRTRAALDTDVLLRAAAAQPDAPTRRSELPGAVSDSAPDWAVLAALLVPDVIRIDLTRADGDVRWLLTPDGSWAYHDRATDLVQESGHRRLWSELEDVHRRWQQLGQPARTRLGLTVAPDPSPTVWSASD